MGMIGGGQGAFIGGVHRMAAALDGQIELVCGAFSSDPIRSQASGNELFLHPSRSYGSWKEMIDSESQLPVSERMDFVSIVTPNHVHFEPAMYALSKGFHVVCDKPMCLSVAEAEELVNKVKETNLIFALTHTYTGYPMVKHAKHLINNDTIGAIRRVVVEYPQGWLSTAIELENQKQASWRLDPDKSGAAGAMGDIGTHAENLAEYITGLEIECMCADLHAHIKGRRLDDDGSILLRYKNGARGVLYASQISAGEENNLRIRIYGEKGSLDWSQMEPNTLWLRWLDKTTEMIRTGVGPLSEAATFHTRVPSGHPEGYIEAFANIYRNVAFAIHAKLEGIKPNPVYDYPGVEDGLQGMKFIDSVVRSGYDEEKKWMRV